MRFVLKNYGKPLSFASILLAVLIFSLHSVSAHALTQSQMISKISRKSAQNTWLGNATTPYYTISGGMFQHYQNGSIYIGNDVGVACVIKGMIRDKWASLGWERSFLGYPTTDELVTPDGIGRYTHFQYGSIYWYPGAGAHEIHGLIRNKWASLNWEKGVLGYPISDELVCADGVGRYTIFQNGRIYYHPTYGTHYVSYGRLYLYWADNGFENSFIGYPKSDPYISVGIPTQNFSKKTLYQTDPNIASGVDLRGEIDRRGIAIRDQGTLRNTCVLQTMNFILEYALTGLAGSEFKEMSVDYAIQAGNKVTGDRAEDSNFPKFLSGYYQYGTVVSSSWPYITTDVYKYKKWNKKMTTALKNNGDFMLQEGLELTGKYIKRDYEGKVTSAQLKQVISYLDRGIPIAQAHAGHAMPIVGYVNNSNEAGGGHLILRNSYGPGAGTNGYETLTYKDFKRAYTPGVELYVFEGLAE